MARHDQHGSTLPVHRVFAVHLDARGRPGRRRCRGRAEHLPYGKSVRFSSLGGLPAFFAAILHPSAAAPGSPHDRSVSEASENGLDPSAMRSGIGSRSPPETRMSSTTWR